MTTAAMCPTEVSLESLRAYLCLQGLCSRVFAVSRATVMLNRDVPSERRFKALGIISSIELKEDKRGKREEVIWVWHF